MYTDLSQFKIGDILIPLKNFRMNNKTIAFIKGKSYIIYAFTDNMITFKSELNGKHHMRIKDLNKGRFVRKEKVPKLYKVLYANNL